MSTSTELDRIGQGIEHVGQKAALMHATANRYSVLNGGSDDQIGELWGWIATLADLVGQLSGWLDEVRAESGT